MAREHIIHFERGYDCIHFECVNGSLNCRPGSGGSHGISGMSIRFLVKGEEGVVQFLLMTGWPPQDVKRKNISMLQLRGKWGTIDPFPANLGYHSKVPRYEGQKSMGPCQYIDGASCYYGGSGLDAMDAMTTLVNGGDEALWAFLDTYYEYVFKDGPYPQLFEYPHKVRS